MLEHARIYLMCASYCSGDFCMLHVADIDALFYWCGLLLSLTHMLFLKVDLRGFLRVPLILVSLSTTVITTRIFYEFSLTNVHKGGLKHPQFELSTKIISLATIPVLLSPAPPKARDRRYCNAPRLSVCLSVRLSVRPSRLVFAL